MKKYIVNFHNKYQRRYVIRTVVLLYDISNMLQLKYVTTQKIKGRDKMQRYMNCT